MKKAFVSLPVLTIDILKQYNADIVTIRHCFESRHKFEAEEPHTSSQHNEPTVIDLCSQGSCSESAENQEQGTMSDYSQDIDYNPSNEVSESQTTSSDEDDSRYVGTL